MDQQIFEMGSDTCESGSSTLTSYPSTSSKEISSSTHRDQHPDTAGFAISRLRRDSITLETAVSFLTRISAGRLPSPPGGSPALDDNPGDQSSSVHGGVQSNSFVCLIHEAPESRISLVAARTLHYLISGGATSDGLLSRAARHYYGEALSGLQRDVASTGLEPGHLLSAVFLLLKAEQFTTIGTDSSSWRRHVDGLLCAIEACKYRSREHKCKNSMILAAIDDFALWDGLLSRKRLFKLECIYPPGSNMYAESTFTSIAIQVPGVLEQNDLVSGIGRTASTKAIVEHIRWLTMLEGQLHDWIRNWYNDISGLPYWVCHDNEIVQLLGPQLQSCPQNTYAFPSMQVAQQHMTYWMCLLALQQAHLDVFRVVTNVQYPMKSNELRARIKRQAGENADSITMAIPYLLQKEHGYYPLMKAVAPLQMVYKWYCSLRDQHLMAYCEKLAEHIRGFGLHCALTE